MPEFTTVSVQEAELRTVSGRQGKYLSEYADYLLQLPHGQAGKLTLDESEKHPTIRRRLIVAAKALGIHIISKRSGNDLYFWREDGEDEQPRSTRRYTRRIRTGSPGSLLPPTTAFIEPEAGEQGVREDDSPELGETEQVVSDAMRRVNPE
jgi:hypothetical protein